MGFKKKWCAPSRDKNRLSCYSKKELINMAQDYNNTYGNIIKINDSRTKIQLWNDIRHALSNICNNEICWAEQSFIQNKTILKKSFYPKMPDQWKEQNLTTWLDEDNIADVMRLYEDKYPNFLFIGPIPLDCGINTTLRCQLTNFDINKLYKNGIKYIGMIINTDVSTGTGIHWYAMFVDLKRNIISFFDSYGEKPYKETMIIAERIRDDFQGGNKLKIEWNKKRHQYDDYNCGMYSMYFIIKKLEGKTMAEINRSKIDTKKMQKMKLKWYRN